VKISTIVELYHRWSQTGNENRIKKLKYLSLCPPLGHNALLGISKRHR
jgi:hypothetical protein